MSSGRHGRAALGGLAAGSGAVLATMGVTGSPLLTRAVLGIPFSFLAVAGGLLVCVAGVVAVMMPRRILGPTPTVPADVAFTQKVAPRPLEVAPVRRPTPAKAPVKALPAVPPPPKPRESTLTQLDDQITELTKKINKAGVMLATGQLSQAGYQHYVGDLKKQRGKLEATRLKAELHK